ncbi:MULTISPECIES: DUF4097 family beta strand repeat-containing protein [unclassified Clostridium]|jgi:hypothetical protein|uniref:DUF4097 family beta strand repeat-containing protein n=1 Tax=Clostridium TaxID=1485 RepID=UPI001C8B88F7|nr:MULTISPECIES: DUF4097 family beta strand repeat-containing protein [unclassified Clostridium]MBX9136890.1 DUF4097 domain-containing protein [Clostridium sp. K12(2020)]MBX9143792.1 DUF4097 domain-containing protein [Clostridium sp. K13]MDU2291618.1 DUF4097 family beta strand repeat-containing protein [Clostridium celatum]MDU4325754.1 DUF4097 family beta strand repeat-containing protein [Clostridium celatum]
MKKIMTLALSLILVLSLSACSVRFEVRNKNNSKSNKTYEVKDINKNVKLENENKIDISIGFGKINIVGYDGNEVIVTGKTNLNVDEINININKEGNSIEISDGNDLSNIDLFKSNNIDVKLMIKIPNNYSGDINLSYGAAEVELSNIDCNNLNIDGGAGELTINDIFFNKLDFNAGVGESEINLVRKCGEIDIDGGVGEISISIEEVGGNLIYEGGVGSAKIKIPENSPVYFNTDSGIGETNINAITSSERTYEFNLSLGIGEIKVYN